MSQAERYVRWRARHPGDYSAQARARLRKREWLAGIKRDAGCRDCDERNPKKLQFHHRDPDTKLFNVSRYDSHGEAALAAEVAKCDVLCHPCHIAEHMEESCQR